MKHFYRGAEIMALNKAVRRIAVVGTGVIGASWSAQYLAVLYEHPAIREAAVFGIPDAKWGELVLACVVLKPGVALSVDELIAHCRRSLASYKVPRRVEFSDLELPKTGSGKILKRALRERFWAHQARAVS